MPVLRVGIAQIAPVPLDRAQTLARVANAVAEAGSNGARLVCFGETFVPGYPFWLSRLDGARFDHPDIKAMHARYLESAVVIERGDLRPVCDACRDAGAAAVVGIAERPGDRGGHTLFASAVTIAPDGTIASVHRKLVPTYEERLAWGPGDAHGLVAHRFLEPFTLGTLNCWENWMPLARATLQAQGVDLHVAIWPGSSALTRDSTRFVALESRAFVVSASSRMTADDLPVDFPHRERILASPETAESGVLFEGGSAVAGPDGSWIVEPNVEFQGLIYADLDQARVLEERQNFDPAGHYGRPELLGLRVDRRRPQLLTEFYHLSKDKEA
ncbi:MAG: carbon-nitrogen hydrolase family protein [Planctomycetota bacterium]